MVLEFTMANFDYEVLYSDKLCVVDFWGEWCGPCAAMRPILEELAIEYAGKVKVGKLNVDHDSYTASHYDIRDIPAIMFFRHGKPVYKHVGSMPKDTLDKEIQEYLKSPDKTQEGLKSQHEPRRERPNTPDSKIMHPGSDGSFKGNVGSF